MQGALAAPFFPAWNFNSSRASKVARCFGLSLSSFFSLPFLSGAFLPLVSLTLSFFWSHTIPVPTLPIAPYRDSPLFFSAINHQTAGPHSRSRSKHCFGRHRYAPASHLSFSLSSSPVDTRIHTRRSIRREPLEISRNISLTLLIRPDFSTPGGGTPPSSCPGIH